MKSWKIDLIWRYVFREVLSPTILGMAVYVLVFLMNAIFELADLAIKKDVPITKVALLLLLYLPRVLELTLPMAVLLGVLVGIGRMSTDSEVVALRACGVSYWKMLAPVLTLGLIAWAFGSYLVLGVEPGTNYSRRRLYSNLMYSADIRREIKPRVFFEEIPGMLLYADQVHQNGDFLEKVFIHQNTEDGKELVTLARRAQLEYDRHNGLAHFYLESGTTHTTDPRDPENYQVSLFQKQMLLKEPDESFRLRSSLLLRPAQKNYYEQTLGELADSVTKAGAITHAETRSRVIGTILMVVHQRFALPFAALIFSLLGLPLGIMNRRGGKVSGFSLSIGIAVFYWILLTMGENFVSQGKLSPYIGLWAGNFLLGGLGILLFILRERAEGLQLSVLVPAPLHRALRALRKRDEAHREPRRHPPRVVALPVARSREETGPISMEEREGADSRRRERGRRVRISLLATAAIVAGLASFSSSPFFLVALTLLGLVLLFGTTLDRYILGRFGVILCGCLVTLSTLFAVYEVINLIDDLVERNLPFSLAISYLKYRTPWILSQVLPMSCLVSTLLVFGIMSRFNEVTALKAGGTSIYRCATPVVMVTLALSTVAYVNQDYLMPSANVKASQIKDVIRGRGARSYEPRERRWVFGEEGRLYNFSNYKPSPIPLLGTVGGGTFQGFSAYLLDPATFQIRQRVYSRTAVFQEGLWVLKDGWEREFQDGRETFETFAEKRFNFPEGPAYFVKEWKTPDQMTYAELNGFSHDLKQRGYDVQELMVDLYDKTAFPFVSLTMVILGLPFCFRMGRRGSLYGVGIAIALVAVFLVTFSTTNALGGIGFIPPFLAAWAPNILFAGSGVYLMLRTGT